MPKCIHGDFNPGCNRPAQVFTILGDRSEGGCGTEIHHHARPSIHLVGGNRSTIRSEPTSRGLLVSTGIPVLTPGPTVNDSASRNAPAILWYSVLRLGTTEETIMAFTYDTSNPSRRSNPAVCTAISSAVR